MGSTLSVIAIVLSAIALFISGYILFYRSKLYKKRGGETNPGLTMLQLQAYERLVLLTERIAFPNLISRLNQPEISAQKMKTLLIATIKQEFEHNATQQLYVSPVSWDAVCNLKEQNIMMISQVAASLPPDASSSELNKKILTLVITQPDVDLHKIVLQALNFEAKKVMK